jgi:alpha-tubulin suppressor-like RCC1 family protein
VTGLTNVTALTAGFNHTCALTASRTLWCWGDNASGQLGDGRSTSFRSAPVNVTSLGVQFTAIDAGSFATCAVSVGNQLYCWGERTAGPSGYVNSPLVPTRVSTAPSAPITAPTVMNGSVCLQVRDQALTLQPRWHLMCWGKHFYRAWGDGTTVQQPSFATIETYSANPRELDGGTLTMCRLVRATGELTCSGLNTSGQLGLGFLGTSPSTPRPVAGAFAAFSGGGLHTCALAVPANEYRCWGRDEEGQLGLGTSGVTGVPRTTPQAVRGLLPPATPGEASVATGSWHTCAIGRDAAGAKQVYCWGADSNGQLGNGFYGSAPVPQRVGSGVLALPLGTPPASGPVAIPR